MVTITSVTDKGEDVFELAWSSDQVISDSNPYRVYQDGVLVSTQTTNTITVNAPTGQIPVFEILDDVAAVPQPGFPAYVYLSWELDLDAVFYLIEKFNGAWEEQATIAADLTRSFQSWQSPSQTDLSTTQWRVTGIDAAGNLGTPTTYSVLMVRHPDTPTVAMSFNSGPRTVTIAAA